MTRTPFTHEDAEEMREDFEDLIDTDVKIGSYGILPIDDVLVCPFGEADKKAFADQYHATKDAKTALAAYTGSEYDVVLYAPNPDDASSYTLVDIRTFIEETGVSYNFPDEY